MKNVKYIITALAICAVSIQLVFSVFAEEDYYKTVYDKDFVQLWSSGVRDYDPNDDGWLTYCPQVDTEPSEDNKMQIWEASDGALRGAGTGVKAVYDTVLNGSTIVKGRNYGINLSPVFWFNANFDGVTPVSGFYFQYIYSDDKHVELVYQDEKGKKFILYSEKEDTVFGNSSEVAYELDFDGETAELKLINKGGDGTLNAEFDSGKINLREELAKHNIDKYNGSGKFAVTADVPWGFLTIKNISIKNWSVTADKMKIKTSDIETLVPIDTLVVLKEDVGAELSIDLNGKTDSITESKLYIDGEYAGEFSVNGNNVLTASLPKLDRGAHTVKTSVKTVSEKIFDIDLGTVYIGDKTVLAEGFICGGNSINEISEVYGQEIEARFKYSHDKSVTAVICLYDKDNHMRSISYGIGNSGTATAKIVVPEEADEYSVKAFMCEDFVNSAPISGMMELK